MALRQVVLASLLDEELSGYQLAKAFDLGVANFWHASPQQLYSELARLEADGMVTSREVVQPTRPTKRLFQVTEAGLAELERFAAAPAKPSFIRDDLLVKVHASDRIDRELIVTQLLERAGVAAAKVEILNGLLRAMRGERSEDDFLRLGERIGPYLTCLRGIAFEQENRDWCERSAAVLRERQRTHAHR